MKTTKKTTTKDNFTDLGVYFVIFFIVLLPFLSYGWLKIGSVAFILAFFAGILNRFLREFYRWREEQEMVKINSVYGERGPVDTRPNPSRTESINEGHDPQHDFIDGQHY